MGGTRYEVEREIDTRIAAELIKRGGSVIIKNRYSVWIEEDGWSVDVFGGPNAPLIVAEAERSGPVTNLTIPKFCITEITDQARFNNDGLANRPFCKWADDFEEELALEGPRFQQYFGQIDSGGLATPRFDGLTLSVVEVITRREQFDDLLAWHEPQVLRGRSVSRRPRRSGRRESVPLDGPLVFSLVRCGTVAK